MSTITNIKAGTVVRTHTGGYRKVLSVQGTAEHGKVAAVTPKYRTLEGANTSELLDDWMSVKYMESKGWTTLTSMSAAEAARRLGVDVITD